MGAFAPRSRKESSLTRAARLRLELPHSSQVLAVGQIRRPMLGGLAWHEGMFVETAFGKVVYDRTLMQGLRRVPVDTFAPGRDWWVTRFTTNPDAISAVMARLRDAISDPSEHNYNLLVRNCEHFSTKVLTGKRGSVQVGVVGGIVVVAAAALALRGGESED